jgi:5-methylcytosine-specific restriction endonuclease McrA
MGRKYEHKASKSFTICLAELAWLGEYSDRVNKKQSVVVNDLIRKAMKEDRAEEAEVKGAEAYCPTCGAWTLHDVKTLICHECNTFNEMKANQLKEKGIRK